MGLKGLFNQAMSSGKRPRNRYVTKPHLFGRRFGELPKPFYADVTAPSAAEPTGLSRSSANRSHRLLRARIAEVCEEGPPFSGEVEADESHFGARRVRGVRERGARGKAVVFGLLKRVGRAHARIVPNVTRNTPMQAVEGRVDKSSTPHADGFASYDGLVDWGRRHHYRVRHGKSKFVGRGEPGNRIDGMEGFWGYARNRLVKYRGMPKEEFYHQLKECEFRFNMRGGDIYGFMLRELRERPLN